MKLPELPDLPLPLDWLHLLQGLNADVQLAVAVGRAAWRLVTWWRRRPHKVKAQLTIPYEALQTVSSMPDGVRARYDQRRIAAHMVAATATINGSPLPTKV